MFIEAFFMIANTRSNQKLENQTWYVNTME